MDYLYSTLFDSGLDSPVQQYEEGGLIPPPALDWNTKSSPPTPINQLNLLRVKYKPDHPNKYPDCYYRKQLSGPWEKGHGHRPQDFDSPSAVCKTFKKIGHLY